MLNLDLSKIQDHYTREVLRQIAASISSGGSQGPKGATGATGAQGDPGEDLLNCDGGSASSIYGGLTSIDGGGA